MMRRVLAWAVVLLVLGAIIGVACACGAGRPFRLGIFLSGFPIAAFFFATVWAVSELAK